MFRSGYHPDFTLKIILIFMHKNCYLRRIQTSKPDLVGLLDIHWRIQKENEVLILVYLLQPFSQVQTHTQVYDQIRRDVVFGSVN